MSRNVCPTNSTFGLHHYKAIFFAWLKEVDIDVLKTAHRGSGGNKVCNNKHCYLPIGLSFAISLTGFQYHNKYMLRNYLGFHLCFKVKTCLINWNYLDNKEGYNSSKYDVSRPITFVNLHSVLVEAAHILFTQDASAWPC